MSRQGRDVKRDDLVEKLAAIEHERWVHWQRYMHSKGCHQPDGSMIITKDLIDRWEHQIRTPYDELSDAEKQSDRDQVMRYLPLIKTHVVNDKA
jgi:hypothetical protein